MVIMVHVVKVVNIVCTFDAPITEMESLDLESDKSQCFNHRDELDSAQS